MLNRYPLWKYLLILLLLLIGAVYALPNLYPEEPAVQISRDRGAAISQSDIDRSVEALEQANISVLRGEIEPDGTGLIRLDDINQQLRARDLIAETLGTGYVTALNLADATPSWLRAIGASPMKLGLDLRGGVHFLLEVDMQGALEQRLNSNASAIRQTLRDEQIRYRDNRVEGNQIRFTFASPEDLSRASQLIQPQYRDFSYSSQNQGRASTLVMTMTSQAINELQDYAVNQNLTTLRNRVNELGVSEPIVQRQGPSRIVVELPGVQDTAAAKRIVGATANLEFRLEALPDTPAGDQEAIPFRNDPNRQAAVMRDVIITGDRVSNASRSFDENGRPQVNINLDGPGGALMNRATRANIGRAMAVVFIEHLADPIAPGQAEDAPRQTRTERGIISLATIQSALGNQFRITGLDSPAEAQELSLLLRSGSLAAPIYFAEERTIGPSLGQQNIDRGITSILFALVLLLAFMIIRYKAFGVVATLALVVNLILLMAIMSILGATLTLPGIAGIVLTLAMAVDGNVLIYERIREELRTGMAIQQAIHAGYDRAFTSIIDSQLTTLLVGVILFSIGTGPVQGFAVTLSIGIITSVFTAVMVSRALTNLAFGGRPLKKLWI
ncbi:protein translocase subunit SecD [Halotalea alkalilenta]|uniref:protein translocase subunit SecD n=1 Tax=Halotalea alkalilenta TaxID=376489 RepID=UPI000486ED29|nr:protein translocase subunit SecD [Halotalea alkalilenta]